MFHHVLIEMRSKSKKQDVSKISLLDVLDFNEIKNEIAAPFVQGKRFQCNGYFVEPNEIDRLVVTRTEKKAEHYQNILQSKVSANVLFFYAEEDAVSNSYDHAEDITKEFLNFSDEISKKDIPKKVKKNRPPVTNKIFIIHGHDEAFKKDVQLFLSRADIDETVLHEQPDKGRSIIDKLIEESTDASYVVALLSPDDKIEDGNSRARQNVIFEIGYFIGKLGKEKVRLLKKGDVEIPSDLQGVLYETYDGGGVWKIKLLKEMKEAGLDFIDLNKAIATF